ncbi:hypothetical protein ACN28G_15105 [Micromonospora sp. WMMA1923]|uniref:hypothetical protein n=1 Tax=Micromonospora sp. WMMA1923 TaxID=3404125 RepID=UPI003B952404
MATPIVVSARGHVFTFNIRAALVWSSDGISREVLNGSAQACTPYAVRALTRLAAARARNYPAHRARELEVELQRRLAEDGPWRFERGSARLTCHPYVWVELDEGVKQAVRPYWEQLIKLDCEHDVDTMKAQYADRLSQHWLTVLEKLVDSPMAGGAARLTDEALAAVVQDLLAERHAADQRLDDLLVDRLDSDDAYERATSFDILAERRRANHKAAGAGRNGAV